MTPEKIRTFRKELGLTQQQLAEKLGVSLSSVARWESEHGSSPRGVSLRALQRLMASEGATASRLPFEIERRMEEQGLEVAPQEEEEEEESEGPHPDSSFLLFIIIAVLFFTGFLVIAFSSYLDF